MSCPPDDYTGRPRWGAAHAPRHAFHATAAVLFAILAYVVIQTNYYVITQPSPAPFYAWQAGRAAARVLQAQALAQGDAADPEKARKLAFEALEYDPLERRAIRVLAQLESAAGNTQRADVLLGVAADRSLRDAEVQGAFIDVLLSRGDYSEALVRIDALMRSRPDVTQGLLQVLVVMARIPETRRALIAYLGAEPPWREQVLGVLAREAELESVSAVLAGLRSGPVPPRPDEISPYFDRLLRDGRFGEAYAAWLGFLAPGKAADVKHINNGGFEREPDGLPYDWRFGRLRNVDIRIAKRQDAAGGQALRIAFASGRVPFAHVSQVLYLPPGFYRLSGQSRAESLRNERGLRWRIACLESHRRRLGETNSVLGSTPWQPFSMTFEVPPEGCGAQVLRLELDARAVLDTEISGRVWYDDLAITPEPPPANAEQRS
jgi:hypothetical protein